MPRTVQSPSPKSAPPPRSRSRVRPKENGGARVLTRAEAMAMTEPPAPGNPSAHDLLREAFRPLREYNEWLVKNGRETLEFDQSLLNKKARQ